MRPLRVEFLPKRGGPRWLWLVCLACVLASAGMGFQAWRTWQRVQVLEQRNLLLAQQLNALTRAQGEHDARALEAARPLPHHRNALALARVAAFPTQAVLKALEATAVEGVRVLSIDLAPSRGSADVSLEFDDYKALLQYIEQLNDGEPEARWSLVRAESGAQRRQALIRFLDRRP